MDQKSLKTGLWQRVAIIAVAVLLLGGTILTYAFVVLGNNSSSSDNDREALITRLGEEYDAKVASWNQVGEKLSSKYFNDFSGYKSQVKAYNSASANAAGLETTDLKVGTGKELTDGDTDYMAYYIGWCADGSIFDSSFNDADNPTALNTPMLGSSSMIEGWLKGIVGMKLGGVRQLTISGPLAYGDTQGDKICGATNSPLKFVVWMLEPDADLVKLNQELADIEMQMYYAYYGGSL